MRCPWQKGKNPKKAVLSTTLNFISCWGSSLVYLFIVITPMSTLTRSVVPVTVQSVGQIDVFKNYFCIKYVYLILYIWMQIIWINIY